MLCIIYEFNVKLTKKMLNNVLGKPIIIRISIIFIRVILRGGFAYD